MNWKHQWTKRLNVILSQFKKQNKKTIKDICKSWPYTHTSFKMYEQGLQFVCDIFARPSMYPLQVPTVTASGRVCRTLLVYQHCLCLCDRIFQNKNSINIPVHTRHLEICTGWFKSTNRSKIRTMKPKHARCFQWQLEIQLFCVVYGWFTCNS